VPIRRVVSVSTVFLLCNGLLPAQALFPKPVKVLGDPEFVGTASNPLAYQSIGPNWVEGREFNAPSGVALDTSVTPPLLYVADTGNNRVLGYRYTTQIVAGSIADVVIGQVDRFSNQAQIPATGRSTGLNGPTGIVVDSDGNLYVADTGNNRILKFPKPFSNTTQFPTMVVGQKTLTTSLPNQGGIGASTLSLSGNFGRSGIAFDTSGNLWVADVGNNRVLRFPAGVLAAGANFPAADVVLGQPDFVTTSTTGISRQSKTGLARPNGISIDNSGRVYVTDQLFRVIEYDSPQSTNQTAARILGIDNTPGVNANTPTQIALNSPYGVLALDTGPIVADTGNNRLMQYSAPAQWPLETAQFSLLRRSRSGRLHLQTARRTVEMAMLLPQASMRRRILPRRRASCMLSIASITGLWSST
jgi:sugar lactone lactonase YvrE